MSKAGSPQGERAVTRTGRLALAPGDLSQEREESALDSQQRERATTTAGRATRAPELSGQRASTTAPPPSPRRSSAACSPPTAADPSPPRWVRGPALSRG